MSIINKVVKVVIKVKSKNCFLEKTNKIDISGVLLGEGRERDRNIQDSEKKDNAERKLKESSLYLYGINQKT